MAHMMKHTKASCGHMFAHFDRRCENISNENVDRSRSHLNYNLATHQTLSQGDFIKKRCSEVHCQNRKDINVMVTWVVTVPKDLDPKEHKAFFQETYDFLEKRYGKENVISSYVHMDEVTPHMHFAFVPVVFDLKKERYKVSAKEKVDRKDLQTFHKDLSKYLERVFGKEIGVLNDATKNGNRSIQELKRESAITKLQELQEIKTEIEHISHKITALNCEYQAKKEFIKECDKVSSIETMYPDYVEKKKNIFNGKETVIVPKEQWEARHVSANEKQYLEKTQQEVEKKIELFKQTTSYEYLRDLKTNIDELKKDVFNLKQKNSRLEKELTKQERSNDKLLERVNKTLKKISPSSADEFVERWKELEQLERKLEKFNFLER